MPGRGAESEGYCATMIHFSTVRECRVIVPGRGAESEVHEAVGAVRLCACRPRKRMRMRMSRCEAGRPRVVEAAYSTRARALLLLQGRQRPRARL